MQPFFLVIKYKKGTTNKLVNLLSRPSTPKMIVMGAIMHMKAFTHEACKVEVLTSMCNI
jgi:hypothetical protein